MAIHRRFVRRICLVASCLPDDALGRSSPCVEDISGRARLDSLVVRSSLRLSFGRMPRYRRDVASSPQGAFGSCFRRNRGSIGRRRSFGVSRRRVGGRCERVRLGGGGAGLIGHGVGFFVVVLGVRVHGVVSRDRCRSSRGRPRVFVFSRYISFPVARNRSVVLRFDCSFGHFARFLSRGRRALRGRGAVR